MKVGVMLYMVLYWSGGVLHGAILEWWGVMWCYIGVVGCYVDSVSHLDDLPLHCREKVHEVPNLLVKHRESKHYLQATELLVNSGEPTGGHVSTRSPYLPLTPSSPLPSTSSPSPIPPPPPPVAQLCQEGELASIEGLRELRADLIKQKEVCGVSCMCMLNPLYMHFYSEFLL